jgi:signal transduction histidine kinase
MAQTNQKMKERVGMLRRAAERANDVVLKLLQFSHVAIGQFRALNLAEHLDAAFALVNNLAKFKNVALIKEYGEMNLSVQGDAILLEQVFVNMLSNAVDAVDEGGAVRVKTGMQDGKLPREKEAVVEIIDNGSGIAPQNLPKIFEPFFTTKEPGKGTGLGLSTAFMIIEHHKGTVRVDSQLGKGTKFTISFPAGNA